MDINEKMDNAVINDDFNKIESIALNPKNAYVKCHDLNVFSGISSYNYRWVDISNVIDQEDYFEDLNSDCQDYVMSLNKYKDMDFDKMLKDYDYITYEWIKKTDAWNLKSFNLKYSQ